MKTIDLVKVALLIVIAIGTTVTAVEVRRIARNGLEMELTLEQAEEVAKGVNEAIEAEAQAEQDMKAMEGEGYVGE